MIGRNAIPSSASSVPSTKSDTWPASPISLTQSATRSTATSIPITITITIKTDDYPGETRWNVTNLLTKEVILEGGPYDTRYVKYTKGIEVNPNKCHFFTIYDSYGDGMRNNGFIKFCMTTY